MAQGCLTTLYGETIGVITRLIKSETFAQPIQFLKNDEEGLFLWCFNRSYQAFEVIHQYEENKAGSFWGSDERYYEHAVTILYERFCYAMAIIMDRVRDCEQRGFFESSREALNKATTFEVYLSRAANEAFKLGARDFGLTDGMYEYCNKEYNDEYDDFGDQHKELQDDVIDLRKSFSRTDRTYLHGFTEIDDDNTYDRDFLHIMRVYIKSSDMDVKRYLDDTKRVYLPTIIRTFINPPAVTIFSDNGQWVERHRTEQHRTLCSLRQCYPTFQIVYGGTDLHLLARQMGTSIAMLEQHYSHLIPRLRADKLAGRVKL